MLATRNIVEIDESRCNGCGLCVPNCHEGALQIIDGKARLVNAVYCDGLGNCLGHCPQDAIRIVKKDVADFNFKETNKHLKATGKKQLEYNPLEKKEVKKMEHKNSSAPIPCGCPGSAVRKLNAAARSEHKIREQKQVSELRQWPIQLSLVPPNAGFLAGSDLLITADCVSVANPDFHRKLLKGRSILMGCPKLDDVDAYTDKIKTIFQIHDIKSVSVAIMEVPCCRGMVMAVEQAMKESGKDIPLTTTVISVDGGVRSVE